jgi:death-on-curing protein
VKDVRFLTFEEIVAIHHDQIRRYGGSRGVRDMDLLISAVSRPQVSFGGEDLYPDLFTKAAALTHSIIMNHAFLDGNKRTGVTACARFLFINGFALKVSREELVRIALNIEAKKWNLTKVSSWLKKHSIRIA